MSKSRRKKRKRHFSKKLQLIKSPGKKRKKRKLTHDQNKEEKDLLQPVFHSPKPRRKSSGRKRKNDDYIPPTIRSPPPSLRKKEKNVKQTTKRTNNNELTDSTGENSSGSEKKPLRRRKFKFKDKKLLLSTKLKTKKRKKTVFRGGEKSVEEVSMDWSLKEKATITSSDEHLIHALFGNPTFVDSSSKVNFVHNTNMNSSTNFVNPINQFQKGQQGGSVIDNRMQNGFSPSYDLSEYFRRSLFYYVFQPLDESIISTAHHTESDHESDGNDNDGTALPLFRKRSQFKSLQSIQKENWSQAFISLYRDFSNGLVPYFYCSWIQDEKFEACCLFIAGGVNGEENPVRVVLYTKTQFRKIQKQIEAHGVEIEANQKGYLIASKRSNVQGFSNFFHWMIGESSSSGCTIYSPCQFLNSTLKKNYYRISSTSSSIGNINDKQHEESNVRKKLKNQKKFIVEIEGVLLPHNIQVMGNALKSMAENFRCSFRVHLHTKDTTYFFNTIFFHQSPPVPRTPTSPKERPSAAASNNNNNNSLGDALVPGFFNFSPLRFGGVDFQYLQQEEDEDMKGRIMDGFSLPNEKLKDCCY